LFTEKVGLPLLSVVVPVQKRIIFPHSCLPFLLFAGHSAESADTFQIAAMFMYLNFSTPTTSQGQDGLLQFVCGWRTSLG
jgi:hypothetical protein